MSKIKSALELAMEKTKDIVVDKDELRRKNLLKTGKEGFAQVISKPETPCEKICQEFFSKEKKEDLPLIKEGFLEGILSQFSLAGGLYGEKVNPRIVEAASFLFQSDLSELFGQLDQMFSQYQEEAGNLKDQLLEQIRPKLEAKARALAQQTGQSPERIMEQDPEFQRAFGHHLGQLKDHYENSILQLKDYLRAQLKA